MKIKLSEIKGLDRRVRQQMSPEKLEELTDSLRDVGQIVPIKVRPNGSGYTLVYGHRRVQAAKAAGYKEIEATVEDVSDDALLTQSLIENVIREDMAAIDIAKALRLILDETGATQEALGKRLGWVFQTVSSYLQMLDPELGLLPVGTGVKAVIQAKAGTGGDIKLAAKVLKKAADEELSTRQTRRAAEVVRQAYDWGGDAAVKRVLAKPLEQMQDTADELHFKRPARKPEPKTMLTPWIKDPQVRIAEEGIEGARSVVAFIKRSTHDDGGARATLRRLHKLTELLLKEIDQALEAKRQ